MTPDIDVMRQEVTAMYPGDKWKRRVKKMPDDQVTAIYLKHQQKAAEAAQRQRKKKSEPDIPF